MARADPSTIVTINYFRYYVGDAVGGNPALGQKIAVLGAAGLSTCGVAGSPQLIVSLSAISLLLSPSPSSSMTCGSAPSAPTAA